VESDAWIMLDWLRDQSSSSRNVLVSCPAGTKLSELLAVVKARSAGMQSGLFHDTSWLPLLQLGRKATACIWLRVRTERSLSLRQADCFSDIL
jgi:hypothetical protein